MIDQITQPKIQGVFKRDEKGKFIMGEFARPELEYLKDNVWNFTEKIDGMNMRVVWSPSTTGINNGNPMVSFFGKTNNAQIPGDLIEILTEMFPVEQMLEVYPDTPMVLFGEGFGPGIQKGSGYGEKKDFALFDVFVPADPSVSKRGWWLQNKDIMDVAEKLDCPTVYPSERVVLTKMIGVFVCSDHESHVSAFGDNKPMEGVVGKPAVDLMSRSGERVMVKLKFKDFR